MMASAGILVPVLVALIALLCVLSAGFIARVVGRLFSYESAIAAPPGNPSEPLLKTYQLAFLLAVGTVLFFWLVRPMRSIRIAEVVMWPMTYIWFDLMTGRGSSTMMYFVGLVLSLGYLFLLWFGIIWSFRHASKDCKVALGLCALAIAGVWWGLKVYGERVDWTSRGLNPDRPGFEPAVVLLAGTFQYRFTGLDTGWRYSGTARFEIRMRGADYYYAERWTGHGWKYGSWDNLTICVPGRPLMRNRSFSGSGHHGGGGGADDRLLVGRRLWDGDKFIGATMPDEHSVDGATERFSKLKRFGQYDIPMRIEFTKGDRREVLKVRRVEFLNEPGTNWFWLVQQKYFDHSEESQQLWKTNLNEAGWSGERRP
jgi:hypothetical protein